MAHRYKVLYFDRSNSTFTVQFEGKEAYNFNAPFLDGAYLEGAALETAIQLLYPYTTEEYADAQASVIGGEAIDAMVSTDFNSIS